eukprot:3098555-Rhodomonas_salina.4
MAGLHICHPLDDADINHDADHLAETSCSKYGRWSGTQVIWGVWDWAGCAQRRKGLGRGRPRVCASHTACSLSR